MNDNIIIPKARRAYCNIVKILELRAEQIQYTEEPIETTTQYMLRQIIQYCNYIKHCIIRRRVINDNTYETFEIIINS